MSHPALQAEPTAPAVGRWREGGTAALVVKLKRGRRCVDSKKGQGWIGGEAYPAEVGPRPWASQPVMPVPSGPRPRARTLLRRDEHIDTWEI